MKKNIFVSILALIFVLVIAGVAFSNTLYVLVDVTCQNYSVSNQIKSYATRELRDLGGVKVINDPRLADHVLSFAAVETANLANYKTGVSFSCAFGLIDHSNGNNFFYYVNHGIRTGSHEHLKEQVEASVATFDVEYLTYVRGSY